jgi:signal transduction histidine kinase
MSHELRTPLNGILGFSELLKSELDDPAASRNTPKSSSSSGEHLLNLVNEILDLAKIESGEMSFNFGLPYRLPFYSVDECASPFTARRRGQGPALRAATGRRPARRVIRTDPMRLRQILNNLLSNAVKFTERGEVTLKSSAMTATGHFAVRDTGPGIAPESHRTFSKNSSNWKIS